MLIALSAVTEYAGLAHILLNLRKAPLARLRIGCSVAVCKSWTPPLFGSTAIQGGHRQHSGRTSSWFPQLYSDLSGGPL